MPQITATPAPSAPVAPGAPPSSGDGDSGTRSQDASFGQALGQARQQRGDTPHGSEKQATQAPRDTAADPASAPAQGGASSHPAAATAGASSPAKATDTPRKKTAKDQDDTSAIAAAGPLSAALAALLRPALAAAAGKSLPAGVALDAAGLAGGKAGTSLQALAGTHATIASAGAAGTGHGTQAVSLLDSLKAATAHTAGNRRDGAAPLAFGVLAASGPAAGGNRHDVADTDATQLSLNALTTLQPAAPPATPAAATAPLQIQAPPGSAEFAQALGQQVAWMGNQDIRQATIHLNPRDLGPLNVNVQVNHGQVDVSFAVQHPATVHALQQTLPQLDALLAQHGLNLGQAHVGQQSHGQSGHGPSAGGAPGDVPADAEAIDAVPATRTLAVGLVDDFA